MKIYITGKTEDRYIISELMYILKFFGHSITVDWTKELAIDTPTKTFCALRDLEGVKVCDIFILYAMSNHYYKGAFCEMGMALAFNKPIFIIGDAIDSCIFMYHPNVKKVKNLYDVISELSI